MTDVVHSSIEEQLVLRGELLSTTTGDSMKPLFHTHGCTVKLVAYEGSAARDDVILWQDASGKYLLHRVVGVTEEGYLTRGDNRRRNDPPVSRDRVRATLAGYYRKETFVPLTARRYRIYVALWGRPNFVRSAILWARDLARRFIGKQPKG